MDCVSKKASPQPLDETADTDKKTNLNESDCLDDKKVVDLNESDCLEGKKQVDLNESDCLESKMLVDLNESDCLEGKKLVELKESDCLDDKVVDLNQSDCLESEKLGELNEPDCLENKKLVDLNQSDRLEGKKLVERSVTHAPSDQTPDGVTVIADEESPSFKTIGFTKTISPPALGTLRSCFSWSGSLGNFSRTPSPSPSTALHQFRRKGGSPSSLPGSTVSDASQVKGDASGDEAPPVHELSWSSQSQESAEWSPRSSSASTLPQPSRKDCSPEVSHTKPVFKSICKTQWGDYPIIEKSLPTLWE